MSLVSLLMFAINFSENRVTFGMTNPQTNDESKQTKLQDEIKEIKKKREKKIEDGKAMKASEKFPEIRN